MLYKQEKNFKQTLENNKILLFFIHSDDATFISLINEAKATVGWMWVIIWTWSSTPLILYKIHLWCFNTPQMYRNNFSLFSFNKTLSLFLVEKTMWYKSCVYVDMIAYDWKTKQYTPSRIFAPATYAIAKAPEGSGGAPYTINGIPFDVFTLSQPNTEKP